MSNRIYSIILTNLYRRLFVKKLWNHKLTLAATRNYCDGFKKDKFENSTTPILTMNEGILL